MPGEAVLVRVAEMAKGWTGSLKLGFTAHNPEEITALPKSTSPGMTRKAGHWAKSLPQKLIKPGALLHYYYLSSGEVCYGVGGKEKGILMSEGIDPRVPLWCLIDLYGSCSAIELEDSPPSQEEEEEDVGRDGEGLEPSAPPLMLDTIPPDSSRPNSSPPLTRGSTPPPSYENLYPYRGNT